LRVGVCCTLALSHCACPTPGPHFDRTIVRTCLALSSWQFTTIHACFSMTWWLGHACRNMVHLHVFMFMDMFVVFMVVTCMGVVFMFMVFFGMTHGHVG
jgi:hypothetical protein